MIKFNVPLKAIRVETDTACNSFPNPLRHHPPLLGLGLYPGLSSPNHGTHVLIVEIHGSTSVVAMFWPCGAD